VGLQLSVFAVATGWFLLRALDSSRRPDPTTHGRLALVHQGVAMAAMFWMLRSMSTVDPMPGMTGHLMSSARGATVPAASTTLVLAGYLAVAAICGSAGRTTRTGRSR